MSEAERKLLEQVPTAAGSNPSDYENQVLSAFPPREYYRLLLARRNDVVRQEAIGEGEDWAFVAITDHNVCGYAAALSHYAWEHRSTNRLIILPGLELDVSFPVGPHTTEAHILLVYSPGTQADDIRMAVRDGSGENWMCGQGVQVSSLPDFISRVRSHAHYPAIAIAAHVSSSKGVRAALKKTHDPLTFTELEAAIARTAAELEHNPEADKDALTRRLEQFTKARTEHTERIALDVLTLLGTCGFDGLQVSCKEDEVHYRRLHRFQESFGRAVPMVASDAHRIADVFACDGSMPYLKLPVVSSALRPEQSLSALRRGIRYGETRFSYSTPGQVARWISGIRITPDTDKAARFWPFTLQEQNTEAFVLPLSRNLTCLVGGRGSGKSAVIEAIAFVTAPAAFQGQHRRNDDGTPDWYKRARATLEGCQVTLVWQTTGATSHLLKGALFSSRYFNPSGEHGPVSYTDLDDKEVLPSSLAFDAPHIFRARDIENAAEPSSLRELFDRLVGQQIPQLERDVSELQESLAAQRKQLVHIARRIADLTDENTPLREYARRKAAYQAANRPEVQPYYKHQDEASAAEILAQDAQRRWTQAVAEADVQADRSTLLAVVDAIRKRIVDKDGNLKPYCSRLALLYVGSQDGTSPRDLVKNVFEAVQSQVAAVQAIIDSAVSETGGEHKTAREALLKQGLPAGAKDREAKKREFEDAEASLGDYQDLLQQWCDAVQLRKERFALLEEKCKERTRLREETASRLSSQLSQDLDSSVLVIRVAVHPTEDRSAFREWLTSNVGPCIPKSKEVRITGLVDKGLMPKQVRDALLGDEDAVGVFIVNKSKANEGRIERELAEVIARRCSGKLRLDPEHAIMKDQPTPEFIAELPKDVREGLWTFPRDGDDRPIADAVLRLDEIIFDDRPEILLNDRPREKGSTMRPLGELSPGQRCSAILPILLLNGNSPLIIDQPEDNLDNRLIRQVIVNILASIKLRRQVIIATHNPNLPVLGDTEQAIVLQAIEERQSHLESTGDLDSPDTVAHLTEIMEGGREAFQYRQSIYQAHWAGPVASDSTR